MLNNYQIYLLFPIIGSVFGAMLWLSYFKKIDVLEHERVIDICLAFIIGFLSPGIVVWIYHNLDLIHFKYTGGVLNDLLYSIAGVGLTEESVKLLAVFLTFTLLKKRVNEPIDYLVFAGIVALGFSIRENFIYYHNYGSQIITGRTLISCLTHIINTSICVYGIYRYKLFGKGNPFINSALAISLAIISHGMFDFFLTQQIIGALTPFLSTIVYLVGINFWIQMFNNAINFSPYFNYEKIIHTSRLYLTILGWYVALLFVEFSYGYYYKGMAFALEASMKGILNEGVLLLIVALRASRLKINKRKYFPLKLQSPIYFSTSDDEDFRIFRKIPIKIRGENEKEFEFLKYMGKDFLVSPIQKDHSVIKENSKARLLKKYFLKNDVVIYLMEVYLENNHTSIFLLKPKTTSLPHIDGDYPIAVIMTYNPNTFSGDEALVSYKSLEAIEPVYLKPYVKTP